MLGALEASTALYLYTADPSVTAIALRDTQSREQLITLEMWRRAQIKQRRTAAQDVSSLGDEAITADTARIGAYTETYAAPPQHLRRSRPNGIRAF